MLMIMAFKSSVSRSIVSAGIAFGFAFAAPIHSSAQPRPSGGSASQRTEDKAAQPSASTPSQAAGPASPGADTTGLASPLIPSLILQPSLDNLGQTLSGLRLEKWKGGSVRAEAGNNIGSIQRDLQGNLKDLLADADAAPASMGKLLLVLRNVTALYDVVLRVYDGARVAGSGEQVSQIEQAMSGLDKARLALNDHLSAMVADQDKQVADLQASLKAQPTPICQAVAAPPAQTSTPAARKKVVKKKPKLPPATQPGNSTPAITQPTGAKPSQ